MVGHHDVLVAQRTRGVRHLDDRAAAVGPQRVRVTVTSQHSPELIAGNRKVREVWVATDLDDNEVVGDILEIARSMRVQVQQVNRKRLEAAARSEAPQGVIAYAAPLREAELGDLLKRRAGTQPFLVAVDGVTDPGNLGALLRSCEGAGVQGVVIPRHRAVHVTPTVAKAAAGAVEHVPMALVGGLPAALARLWAHRLLVGGRAHRPAARLLLRSAWANSR